MEESNRRRHTRRSVRIDGTILLPDEKREIRVLVVNLSPSGVAVETDATLAPGTPIVLNAGEFGRFEGKIKWRRGGRLGVLFDSPGSLSEYQPTDPTVRSPESAAFEQMWRSLVRDGPIPKRGAFQPRLAKPFLPHIILAQAPSFGDATIRIRVAGDAIRRYIQRDIVGDDFLEFMEGEERKARVLDVVREMFERPCGQRWVAPVQYERGFSHYWEVTAFPLAACELSPAMVLALITPFNSLLDFRRNKRTAVRLDAAVHYEAITLDP